MTKQPLTADAMAEAALFSWISALVDRINELEERVAALEAHKVEPEPEPITSPGLVWFNKAKLSDQLKIMLLRNSNKILVEACKNILSTYVFLDSSTAGIEPQHTNTMKALDAIRFAIDAAEKTQRKTSD